MEVRNTVLVVDDEREVRETIRDFLVSKQWQVIMAGSLEEASTLFQVRLLNIALVLADDRMNGFGHNGVDFYLHYEFDLQQRQIPFVLMTTSRDEDFLRAVQRRGMHLLLKPFGLRLELSHLLVQLFERTTFGPTGVER